MIRKIGAAAGAGALFFLAAPARAIDGAALQAGYGDDSTSLLRLSVTRNWRGKRTPSTHEWRLAGYWEFVAGLWDNKDYSTAEIGVTPVFRFERNAYYVEGAIGFHLVSTHISAQRTFSSSFQFADHLGFGFRFGGGERYDLGVRIQHLSNGGISSPNPGINFVLVRLQYELE